MLQILNIYIYLRTSIQVINKVQTYKPKKVPICLSVDTTSAATLSKNKFCILQCVPVLQKRQYHQTKATKNPEFYNPYLLNGL